MQRKAILSVVFFGSVMILMLVLSALARAKSGGVEQSEVFVIGVISFLVVGVVFLVIGVVRRKGEKKPTEDSDNAEPEEAASEEKAETAQPSMEQESATNGPRADAVESEDEIPEASE